MTHSVLASVNAVRVYGESDVLVLPTQTDRPTDRPCLLAGGITTLWGG